MSDTKSFWTTLPGILSGIAAVIGAIVSLLLVLMQLNIINPASNGPPPENKTEHPSPPSTLSTDPLPGQAEDLKNRIYDLTFKIDELNDELTRIAPPAGLLQELEHHKINFENRIAELNQILTAARREINELRGHDDTEPNARSRIHSLEEETIPDHETEKRYVENELNTVAEEILKAKKKKELVETLYELEEQKQYLQDQLNRLTMPKDLKP